MIAAVSFFWWLIFFVLWGVIFLPSPFPSARAKGHSALLWGLLACFLPGITVIIVLLLPNRTQGGVAP